MRRAPAGGGGVSASPAPGSEAGMPGAQKLATPSEPRVGTESVSSRWKGSP